MSDQYKKSKSFLGTGWAFPPTFHDDRLTGVEMVKDAHDIKESLVILLNTNLGERIMLPEYGSDLQNYLFDLISNSKLHFLKNVIRTAILKFEPRITVNDIIIDQKDYQEGIIRVIIKYTVKSNNTRFNLVFPYYKMEGTDIPVLFHKHVTLSLENETIE
jgi:phage baseplate assembly protein W